MHDQFAKKDVNVLIKKALLKMLSWTNNTYIIDSDKTGTQKAEYIIGRYIESDSAVFWSLMFFLQNINVL